MDDADDSFGEWSLHAIARMARSMKLKVFRTPAGFYDAYVAAPSQKAALEAWGSEHDLFARGVAELVTDPALIAEPLASPGSIIKRSRGTTAEQIAALPASDAPPAKAKSASKRPAAEKDRSSAKPRPKPKPKPSSAGLEAAETALERVKQDYEHRLSALAKREAVLAQERRDLEDERRENLQQADDALAEQRRAFDAALRLWRAAKAGD